MAILTRFSSTSATPSVARTAHADPGVYSEGFSALANQAETAQKGTQQIFEAQEKGPIAGLEEAFKKRDQMLYEQGKMQLSIDAHNLYNQYRMDPRSADQKLPEMQEKYNKLIQQQAGQLSDPATAGLLTAHSGIMMSRMVGSLQAQDIHRQQQAFSQNLEQYTNQFATMLYKDPSQLQQTQEQFKDYAKAMAGYGFNPNQVGAALNHAQNKLSMAAYRGLAATQPEQVLDMIKSGGLADMPLGTQLSLQKQAEATINGRQAQVGDDLKNLQTSMLQGSKLPEYTGQILNNAMVVGLQDQVKKIQQAEVLRNGIASLPVAEQQSRLNNFLAAQKANPTMTPDELQFAKKTMEGQINSAVKDPLNYAVSQGVIPTLSPMVSDPADKNFMQSFEQRRDQVNKASVFTGAPVSPFTQAEAAQINSTFGKMDVNKQIQTLSLLDKFPQDSTALAISQFGKANPVFGAAASLLQDKPDLAKSILNGQKVLESGVSQPPTPIETRPAVQNVFGDLFKDNPEQLGQIESAARARYADIARTGGTPNYEDALREVSGTVKLNSGVLNLFSGPSYNTMVPVSGMSQGQMENLISGLSAEDFKSFGNGTPRFTDGSIASEDQAKKFQFFPVGKGQYILKNGKNFLVSDDMQTPYTINLRQAYLNPRAPDMPTVNPSSEIPEQSTNPNEELSGQVAPVPVQPAN